jgi:hypothetical protein
MKVNANARGTYLDPLTNTVVQAKSTLAADHVVAQSWIRSLPGFDKLTPKQQGWMLNHPLNTQGLPQPLNSSKGARAAGEWKTFRGQPLDSKYQENEIFRETFLKGFISGYVKTMSE